VYAIKNFHQEIHNSQSSSRNICHQCPLHPTSVTSNFSEDILSLELHSASLSFRGLSYTKSLQLQVRGPENHSTEISTYRYAAPFFSRS